MLYSLNGAYPTTKPTRVRLPDGSTRTSDGVNSVLEELGYVQVSEKPDETSTHRYEWVAGEWQPVEKFWAIRVENNQVFEVELYTGQDLANSWLRFGATYFSDKAMPAPGYSYNPQTQLFSAPRPFPSWMLNTQGIWEAPTAYPNDGKRYEWNEQSQIWVEIYDGNS
jgi:hypothetical protein